ncbi:hypothetical protein HPB47_011177 [Ixodes persulcatus]|uniref:Uncharacterized protein n=1 Tax=Ixodes persulcatus TaxID=34615 RepID=A0AC60NX68_IXOPE|nr:hypothetical protein HPB47_011177 [Ixodes persulcatus]
MRMKRSRQRRLRSLHRQPRHRRQVREEEGGERRGELQQVQSPPGIYPRQLRLMRSRLLQRETANSSRGQKRRSGQDARGKTNEETQDSAMNDDMS